MNWLDIVIVAVVVIAALAGAKTGLIAAAFTAVGILIGLPLAGQISDKIGGLFDEATTSDTVVTVVSYAIIVIAALVIGGVVARIIRPFLSAATLGLAGMADKLGGLGLGAIIGLAVSGGLILGMARFAYNFEVPELVADRIPDVAQTRESVEGALTDSVLVPIFIDITDAIPASALGYVPSDFKASLDILEKKLD